MSDTMILETSFGVKYTNGKPLPIDDIISSLRAYEGLIKRTPAFLEKHYQGIKILETHVFVSTIESGSLIEKFIIRYVFKTEDNYNETKQLAEKIMGDNETVKTIVAMGVGAAIMYGASSLLPANAPANNITAYNNTIINVGGTVEMSSADIKAILDSTSDKKTLAKQAVAAIQPAKKDSNASIEIEGQQILTINKETIAEAPDEYNLEPPAERTKLYQNVDIAIFASDRDNMDKGWAGVVNGIIDHRVKFIISDAVDPKKLHGRINMKADIEVTESFVQSKKAYQPKYVEILKTN